VSDKTKSGLTNDMKGKVAPHFVERSDTFHNDTYLVFTWFIKIIFNKISKNLLNISLTFYFHTFNSSFIKLKIIFKRPDTLISSIALISLQYSDDKFKKTAQTLCVTSMGGI
jgi:hypothetical protein